jgi:putative addiction module component (TIGR02574 family)
MATLPDNVSNLSDAEKFELLDALWADLESHPHPLSTDQAEALDRRVAAYETNPSDVIAWEDIKARQPQR